MSSVTVSPSPPSRMPAFWDGSAACRNTRAACGSCTRSSYGGSTVFAGWEGALVAAFEDEARRRGALTVTLGTDDDGGQTSLAGVDLYEDIPRHIAELRDLGSRHPFLFYRRMGYVVTGCMPDANGPGRPDIYMSKSAGREDRRRQPAEQLPAD